MFDPTIYENIKVVLEGEIYDLDLGQKIIVIDRNDLIDLARMSRTFQIQFKIVGSEQEKSAKIQLKANTEDLSKEILEWEDESKPGCEIKIEFSISISNPKVDCEKIEMTINQIWEGRPEITQTITYDFKKEDKPLYYDHIQLNFGRKIDEDNIEDIHELVNYTYMTLQEL
ncbi:hypothetical protein [Tepidibacillus decaturensis]|uniref:Uncharacterized protein n=1 Tax=Tepidibacillus decaturensis TaxID=1413211 RepID=A0A135L152_9BACI|nr:hypothetical protein [Tepidibacillus decaturensis]KXG42728.1 hypothetical protein U473_00720 [Tepidibacillus decaturensis]